MSHVSHTRVKSDMYESFHIYPIYMNHFDIYQIHCNVCIPACQFEVRYIWIISHIYMNHFTYWTACIQWVMSRMNESCDIWKSHVTYGWVMSRMDDSCQIWMSHITYGWVTIAREWMIPDHTYEWVMSHMDESCHMNEWCHIWMCHFTYGWVMSHMDESCHIWMSHVTGEIVMSRNRMNNSISHI